eukprot:c28526_g1_i1 orf=69-2879(+)
MAAGRHRRSGKRVRRRLGKRKSNRFASDCSSDSSDEDYDLEEEESSYEDPGGEEEEHRMGSRLQRTGQQAAAQGSGALRASRKRIRGSGDFQETENLGKAADGGRVKKVRYSGGNECSMESLVLIQDDDVEEKNGKDERGGTRKGKEKIEEVDGGVGNTVSVAEQVCGICLIEGGTVDRGVLDCCDHYFCYVCIMEWAKVESRCPMCKQRFVKIVKPAVAGMKRSRTVRIPLRDQVYVPSEEEIRGFEDPYSNIVCMECHESGEERLLLLCDHCDAAAHTYCVGLGRSVPRGDWFCHSCQSLLVESSSSEEDDFVLGFSDDDEAALIRAIVATPTTGPNRSRRQATAQRSSTVSTRVRRPRQGVRRRLWRRLTHRRSSAGASTFRLPHSTRPSSRQTVGPIFSVSSQTVDEQASSAKTGQQASAARTVPNQRLLHERIQIIRENWEDIRRGSRQFSSEGHTSASSAWNLTSLDEHAISSTQPQSKPHCRSTVSEENSRSLCGAVVDSNPSLLSRQGTGGGERSLASLPSKQATGCMEDSDAAQAWAMMEHAKTLNGGSSSTGGQQRSRTPHSHDPILTREENNSIRQHVVSATKGTTVSHDKGISYLDSPELRNGDDNVLKQSELKGITGKMETAECSSMEEPQNHRQEFLNFMISGDIRFQERDSGSRQKETGISASCDLETALPFFKDFKDSNQTKPPIGGNGKGSDNVMGAAGTTQINSLSPATSSVNRISVECRCNPVHSISKGIGNLNNGLEHTMNHQRFEMARPCSDGIDCRSDIRFGMDVTTSSKTCGGGITLSLSGYEQQQTIPEAASCAQLHMSDHLPILDRTQNVAGMKDQVASLVKMELWPIYLSKGLGKEQFKSIARSATHALLAICGLEQHKKNSPQVKILSCCHSELQGQSFIAGFCDTCFKVQVQDVVKAVANRRLSLTGM